MGRRDRTIASSPRLRFSPLEVFAQRQFQPILARILCGSGWRLVFMLVILHREPVRMRRSPKDSTGRIAGWAKCMFSTPSRRFRRWGRMGNRIDPQKELAGVQRRFSLVLVALQAGRALAQAGALWQGSARLVGAFFG